MTDAPHPLRVDLLTKWRLVQAALADEALGSAEKLVYAKLLDHLNGTTLQCNPSFQSLGAGTGLARSTVIVAVKHLAEGGWVSIQANHHRDGRSASNGFWINFEKDKKGRQRRVTGSKNRTPAGSEDQTGEGPEFGSGESDNRTTGVQNLDPGGSENRTQNNEYGNQEKKPGIETSPACGGANESLPPSDDLFPPGDEAGAQSPILPSKAKKKTGDALTADFEEWWKQYPKRVGKKDAERVYAKARQGGATREELLIGAARYAGERDRVADPADRVRYTKHPSTWLNQGCWSDEPAPAPEPGKRFERAGLRRNERPSVYKMAGLLGEGDDP
jgi:hypothetical protein